MVTLEPPDAGPQLFPGFPIHFGRRTVTLANPPGLGDDNERVLASLGYSAREIADLAAAQVIFDSPPEQ
jgi:crotonobetainyl-CoA:carnitine CoA-transferase CaiB-like acyl-CoA transferase